MALPTWLDDNPAVDFSSEKDMLGQITDWAARLGWESVSPTGFDFSERAAADLVLRKGDRVIRAEVNAKSKGSGGMIRIQAVPTFRDVLLVKRPRRKDWEIHLGSVPLDFDWTESRFAWLIERLFAA